MGRRVLAGVWRGARAGLVIGTMYFLVLAVLVFFGAALGSGTVSLSWLVLFVGAGAACGLVLGAAGGAGVGWAVGRVRGRAARHEEEPSAGRLRLVGAAACGGVVLVLCVLANVTGFPGVLAPEPTTTIVLPTLVAAWAGASVAVRR